MRGPKREFSIHSGPSVTARARTCAPRGGGVGQSGSPRSGRVGFGAQPRLVMTRQTIPGHAAVLMTAHAPAHAEWLDLNGRCHLCHVAMTCRTLDPGSDVRLVAESYVVREVVDPHPRDRLLVFPVLEQPDDLGPLAQHHFVAPCAPLHRRNAGHRAPPRVGVTELAIDPGLDDVAGMTERNRLCRRVGRRPVWLVISDWRYWSHAGHFGPWGVRLRLGAKNHERACAEKDRQRRHECDGGRPGARRVHVQHYLVWAVPRTPTRALHGDPECPTELSSRGCTPNRTRPLRGDPECPTPRPRGAHVRAFLDNRLHFAADCVAKKWRRQLKTQDLQTSAVLCRCETAKRLSPEISACVP